MIGNLVEVLVGTGTLAAILAALLIVFPAFFKCTEDGANKRFAYIEKHSIKVGAVFFIVALIVNLYLPIPYVYSDGTKKGALTKITKKGFIFKTWEGELNLGGMTTDAERNTIPNIFQFSITDEKVFNELLLKENSIVSLKYNQLLRVPLTMGDSNYIITEVR